MEKDYAEERVEDTQRGYSPSSTEKHGQRDNDQLLSAWRITEQKRLIRRVDYRLIPICGIMYCVSLLDRTNLSNANIAGMGVELNLTKVNGVDRYVRERLTAPHWTQLTQPSQLSLWSFSSPILCASRLRLYCAAKLVRESSYRPSPFSGASSC